MRSLLGSKLWDQSKKCPQHVHRQNVSSNASTPKFLKDVPRSKRPPQPLTVARTIERHYSPIVPLPPLVSSPNPPTGHPEAPTQCSSTGSGPKQRSQCGSYIMGEKWYCFTGKAPTTLQALISCTALGVTSHTSVTNAVRKDTWLDTGHHRKYCISWEKFPTCKNYPTLAYIQ